MKEFVTLQLCEKDYIFRALNLDQLEELEPQFAEAMAAANATGFPLPKKAVHAVAEIACASLQFKHPGITVAEVRKLLTISTMEPVMYAVRGVSQLVPSGEGEAGDR
jgi:hypothetical protein